MSEPTQVSPQVHVIGASETASVLPSRRFTVVKKLGEGGMGAVYEVVDRESQARMALKALSRVSPEGVERFKNEFRSLQDLHHPNLVSLGELVEEEGHWFFTMELVRGCHFLQYVQQHGAAAQAPSASPSVEARTLVQEECSPSASADEGSEKANTLVLDKPAAWEPSSPPRPEPERQARSFDEARLRASLVQLARGLQVLHRAGKVHRDIKPSNILVTESGRVVLLDFGVLSDVQEQRAQPGAIIGTPSFMAPEQAGGAPPSPEADWYSVGVLLYVSLTGALPFSGSPREVMRAKQEAEPLAPQERERGLPGDLCALCMELLQRDPANRPTGERILQWLGEQEQGWAPVALPFVGRQEELALLHQALPESRQGNSVTVLVEGESGVGKSRLVGHFLGEAAQQWPGALVLRGRCYERESVPYKGVDGVIKGLVQHLKGLGEAHVHALAPPDCAALAQLFPMLQQVPGLSPNGARVPQGDPLQVRVAAFLALRELLARLAAGTPVLLSVDDLQWMDRDGLALLDEVLQAPCLLLVATVRLGTTRSGASPRPEEQQARFLRKARSLPVRALPPAEARDLVEQLLGIEALREPEWARRIVEESRGHPLFLDALVRYHRAGMGAKRPLELEEALWARAQHLEPEARQLLELLAVADMPLSQAVATQATTVDFAQYGRQAAALRTAHLALTTGPAGSDTIEVVHDRVRQAVARHLEPAARRAWHLRLATSLEELQPGAPEVLAHHWRGAGQVERAVGYYLQAAQQAGEALAFAREASLYASALELGTFEPSERRRLQTSRAEALSHAGRVAEAADTFLETAQGAPEDEAHALRRRAAEQYLTGGKEEQGLQLLSQVLAEVGLRMPRSTGAQIASVVWQRTLVSMRSLRPRPSASQQLTPELQRLLEACWVAGTTVSFVRPLISFDFHCRYLRMALASGHWEHMLRALASEALFLACLGRRNHPNLMRLLARLEPLAAHSSGDPHAEGFLSFIRMAEPLSLGDLARARPHLEACLHQMQQFGKETWLKSLAWVVWTDTMLAAGELLEMHQRLAQPLAAAREAGGTFTVMVLQCGPPTMGWLALDEPQEARRRMEETRAWCQKLHDAQMRGQCYVDLYEGRSGEVLQQLKQHMARMLRETPVAMVRCLFYDIRSRALLMEAGQQGGGKAQPLLRAAEADARRLEREGLLYAGVQAALVRAGVARQQGRLEQALAGYARVAEEGQEKGMHLLVAAARWRHGELWGGEEGKAQVLRARTWMRERGIRSPEAMVGLIAPASQNGVACQEDVRTGHL